MLVPADAGERAEFLDLLARRVTPSADFFLFSFLSGLVLVAALLFNSPALYVLAALMAPFLAASIGLSLASIVGSGRFFLRSLGAMLIASLIIFACGAAAGLAAGRIPGLVFDQTVLHARFTWPDFALLSLGMVLTCFLIVRSPQNRPLVTSVALAYELFLPLGVAGFGLVSGVPGLWPDGLIVFAVHLAWAALLGTATFAVLGLRPVNLFGYTLGTTWLLVSIAAAVMLSGVGTALETQIALPPTPTASITPTPTLSGTPRPPTLTVTPTRTLVPSRTVTLTGSPEPTPVWARISAKEGGGAVLHDQPNFKSKIVKTLINESLVQVLPDAVQGDGVIWRKVRAADGTTGWIWEKLLITATPAVGW